MGAQRHHGGVAAALVLAGATACIATAKEPAVASPGSAMPPADARLGAPSASPFTGARLYVDPAYGAQVEAAAAAMPEVAAKLRRVARVPTAVWLDSIAKARTVGRTLEDAAAQERAAGEPVVTVFVVYDVPGRDCAAASSTGELAVPDGELRYRSAFVDAIAAAFRAHPAQRIVAVLEPDSLANVATSLDRPACAAAAPVYRRAVAYALRALSLPNVAVYLDAAHGGWLGWDANRHAVARVFADVIAEAGVAPRGFALNVSGYDPLTAAAGPPSANPCPDELTYARKLAESLAEVGVPCRGVVVDTSRNGRAGIRTQPGSWCNVRGAGLGERPRATPAPGVDAYLWIKPPGESDGTSDPSAPRYDPTCGSPDGAPGAPQAGAFFPRYLAELVASAEPPL
jgi:cellulose 1,4-beta-cellobiosidase